MGRIGDWMTDITDKTAELMVTMSGGHIDKDTAYEMAEREMQSVDHDCTRFDVNALIDEAFAQALDKLEAMPSQQARAFLMTEAAAVADGDEIVILGSKNPGWFDDKFLADLNTLLQKQGKPGQLTLGNETRDGETGLILAKNGMEISCTFASLLDSRRLDMEADIAAILFPDRPA